MLINDRSIKSENNGLSREFNFQWVKSNETVEFKTDVSVPFDSDLDDYVGLLVSIYKVPCYACYDLKCQLSKFIQLENDRYHEESGKNALEELFSGKLEIDEHFKEFASINNNNENYDEAKTFRDAFCAVIASSHNFDLMKKERDFAHNVNNLIKRRDKEIKDLQEEHQAHVKQATDETGFQYSDTEVNRIAAQRFEQIHLVEAKYDSQIMGMATNQRNQYKSLVLRLHSELQLKLKHPDSSFSLDLRNVAGSSVSEQVGRRDVANSFNFAKKPLEESYTIYLGAQMKTMQNIRLVAFGMKELLLHKSSTLEESQRLQMALNLYGDQLSGVVCLVDNRPTYHVDFNTDFAKCCERSTELHFADLDKQLSELECEIQRASEHRMIIARSKDESEQQSQQSFEGLHTGDVYLTRHSNLSQVHIGLHLVADSAVKHQEINSRHPCLNGLRNIIKLCTKFGISNIYIPLLLLHEMTEEITIPWCLKRAELVLKCVKGYMMECFTLPLDQHLTVNFVTPNQISNELFLQLAEMLPQIFHVTGAVR